MFDIDWRISREILTVVEDKIYQKIPNKYCHSLDHRFIIRSQMPRTELIDKLEILKTYYFMFNTDQVIHSEFFNRTHNNEHN